MNSFRFLERGIEAEIERQTAILEGGGDGRAGDAPLRPRRRLADAAALQGVRARLPLLPRARPGPARADRGDAPRGARGTAGAASRTPRALHDRARALRGGSRAHSPSMRSRRVLRAGGGAGGTGSVQGARKLGHGRAGARAARGRCRRGPAEPRKATPEAVAALAGLVEGKTISHGAGKQVLAELVAEGGDPARIVEDRGLAQIADAGELEADRRPRDRGEARGRRAGPRGKEKAIGRIVGAVMKETKGRADGGAVAELIRERL